MNTHDVIVQCDVHMTWTGPHPRYRVWVNDELFTERTWIWDENFYLEEIIPIQAASGEYQVRYEVVDTGYASIKVRNWQTVAGTGQVASTGITTGVVCIEDPSK